MTTSIYLRNRDGSVIEMMETAYDSEDLFQRLLAESQELLPGAQIDPESPRRWLLVGREVGVPDQPETAGRWSLDHLFLDQDGIPTFVEVKRSSDTRLRREVVGQMLDYAANATVYWPTDFIYERFAEQCDSGGFEADEVLTMFLGNDSSVNHFWENVHTNLLAGKIRLLFVADSIPTELRRIIEFLNERMDPTEVLGIEIKQYVGEDLQSFIPTVIGRTTEAQAAKTDRRSGRQWDEDSFFSALATAHSDSAVRVAHNLLLWAREKGLRVWWGKGKRSGSFFPMLDTPRSEHWTFSVWTYGTIEIQFQQMLSRPSFDTRERRMELRDRFSAISGILIPADGIDRRPSVELVTLSDERQLTEFLSVWNWYVDEIREDCVSQR